MLPKATAPTGTRFTFSVLYNHMSLTGPEAVGEENTSSPSRNNRRMSLSALAAVRLQTGISQKVPLPHPNEIQYVW